MLGLRPSQNPQYLVLGPNEAQVLDASLQKEFSESQSDRQEVDLFRFRENPQTQCVWAIAEDECRAKCGMVSFYRLGNFTC